MHILFITHKYPPSVGGMEKQSYELIQGFLNTSTGHVIAFDGETSLFSFFIGLKKRVLKCLNDHPEIEIIHLNDGLMASVFYFLKIHIGSRKVVVTLHGLDVVFSMFVYQKYILPNIKKFDGFICVSRATHQECLARGFDPKKLFIVANGVFHGRALSGFINAKQQWMLRNTYGIRLKKDILILCIGRPIERKGFSWFAQEVLPFLPKNYKMIHVGFEAVKSRWWKKFLPLRWRKSIGQMTGSPIDAQALQLLSESTLLKGRLILAGKLDDDMRDLLITASHVIVLPNIEVKGDMEGFGLVALEAAVQGKLVVASNLEGLRDAICPEKNGRLIPSKNKEIWYKTMAEIDIHSPKYYPDIREYTMAHFSWKMMVEGYKNVFQKMV